MNLKNVYVRWVFFVMVRISSMVFNLSMAYIVNKIYFFYF